MNETVDVNYDNFVSQSSFDYKLDFKISIERREYYSTENLLIKDLDTLRFINNIHTTPACVSMY